MKFVFTFFALLSIVACPVACVNDPTLSDAVCPEETSTDTCVLEDDFTEEVEDDLTEVAED